MTARLCICQACNTVSVQEAEESPICGKCSSEDVDWTNLDAKQLRQDLQDCIAVLASWETKEDNDDQATTNRTDPS